MKGLIVSLAVLAGLAAAADFVARATAEGRIAARLETALELNEEPDVEIGGWPFLLEVADGTLPALDIASSDVTRRGLTLERVELHLVDLRFDVSELMRDSGEVRIGGGSGVAEMTGTALNSLLQANGAPVQADIGGGNVSVAAEGAPGEVEGDITLQSGDLVVSGEGLPRSYFVALPRLGKLIDYRSLNLVGDRLRLMLELRSGVLRL